MVGLGYNVSAVAFHLHNWSSDKELLIKKNFPEVNFHYLEPTRKNIVAWLSASIAQITARVLFPVCHKNLWLSAMVLDKRSWLLTKWVKQQKLQPNWVIAHNPAAFYPAYKLAQKWGIPFALDIEDYHPGENGPDRSRKAVTQLMRQLLPQTVYISYASVLIKNHTEKLLNRKTGNSILVNNFFPSAHFTNDSSVENEKLQMVWFSQNIDAGRGLEKILPVFKKFNQLIDLTLIGNPKEPFCTENIYNKNGITVIQSIGVIELNRMMSQFDIGLAIEPGKDLNNTIALSNKILTYFQAGLYILASDTDAQNLFIKQHSSHGVCTSLALDKLTTIFEVLIKGKGELRALKEKRFRSAAAFSWENESVQLIRQWEAIC